MSRPPAERRTQGTFHSAPRAEGVRWGTVATSATLPRDHPGRQTGGTRLSRPHTERGTQGTSHSAPRAEGVRWGTVATSATLPRDPPGGDNGRDALVVSTYGTWNTGDIPFSATRRGRSMGHGRDKRDPPARRCRSMGHGRDKRDPPARPSRRRQTGGTRLSRPPTERGVRPRNLPGETSRDPPRAKKQSQTRTRIWQNGTGGGRGI